jgi:hypothetical protein
MKLPNRKPKYMGADGSSAMHNITVVSLNTKEEAQNLLKAIEGTRARRGRRGDVNAVTELGESDSTGTIYKMQS